MRKILAPTRFMLSSTRFRISSNIKELEKSLCTNLDSEIKGEEFDVEREKYLTDFLEQHKWNLHSCETSTRLMLTKSEKGHSIKVMYDAKLPESANENEEEEQKEGDEQSQNYTEFLVVVDKNKANKMLLDVIAVDGEINLNGMVISPNADAIAEKKMPELSPYNGPAFETLDEKLQTKISKYMAGLGIDEELVHFIEESAIHHEAKLYKNFLNEFKNFVE